MQRSSDQAAVHRMEKNSPDQCVTLKMVMGFLLPDWLKENREVLFPGISCCLSGTSNWKWGFLLFLNSCRSQNFIYMSIAYKKWVVLCSRSSIWKNSVIVSPVLEGQSSPPVLSACTSRQVTLILTSGLGFYFVFLCIFTVLRIRVYLNGIPMYTLKKINFFIQCQMKCSKPNNENYRLSLHYFSVRLKM